MATVPNGAEGEVAFISGVTSAARVAGTSFAMWQGNNPATYATTGFSEKWGSTALSTSGTAGGNLTYWFDTAAHWSAAEQNAFVAGLQLWSAEANITFSQAASAGAAQFTFFRGAVGGGAFETFTSATQAAAGSAADGHAVTAKIVIDTSRPYYQIGTSFDNAGGFAWQTLVHEEGHLIGLGHGGPYNGTVNEATQQFSGYDTRLWTLMSYIDPTDAGAKFYGSYPVTGTNWGFNTQGDMYEATTPMMLDILAAQRLYGVQTSGPLSAGGQVFGFHTNLTGPIAQFFDFTVNQHPVITIWDGGLNNTLDLSGWSEPATISLVAGTFSSAHGMVNDLAIAEDTRIDNVVGGAGADNITGNAFDDTIRGGPGNDTINGGGGLDTAIFSGARSAYTLTDLGGGSVRVSGPDGIDTLASVELLRFDDQTVTWPLAAHAPTITSNGGGDAAAVSILENSTAVTTVTATDPDAGTTLTYAIIGGADQGTFHIDTVTGVLSFIAAPDFENPTDSDHNNSYVVQVRASDGSLSDTQTITVTVADVNEIAVRNDFNGDRFSDALFRNDATGAFGWSDVHNASTFHDLGFSSVSYGVGGIGDFNADGFADILFRNGADGDFGYTDAHNGSAWHDIGRSGTAYAVAGIEDFNHDGFVDVLFRNNSGGDFGYTDVRNGSAWHDIGPSDTGYAVVGVADFTRDGFADVLFRNAAGNFGYTDVRNASAWHDTGRSDPAYAVARAGDFNGDGFADVLFRNNATGDFGYTDVHNGSAWHDIGPSDTAYAVAGVADFNGDGFADVLFRNDATGDFGYTDVHNGSAWHDIGPSTTSWHLV